MKKFVKIIDGVKFLFECQVTNPKHPKGQRTSFRWFYKYDGAACNHTCLGGENKLAIYNSLPHLIHAAKL